jgi:peptide/nickel transport system permease protein
VITQSYAPVRTRRSVLSKDGLLGNWPIRVGVIGLLLIILAALAAPLLTPFSPTAINMLETLQPPSVTHPFGTDQLGRDVLSRVLYGARIDLLIGFVGVSIPLVAGMLIGLVAGYLGGWWDAFVGRIIDIVVAFPFMVLVIAIVAMLGAGLANFFIAIFVVSWVTYARIIRGETLVAKQREYVLAARGLGYSPSRIATRHILPNVVTPALVYCVSDFVLTVLAGASLGYFGLGVQPPTPEWGVMIAQGQTFLFGSPWIALFPGLAIILLGFFVGLIGEGVSDRIRRIPGT